MVLLPFLYLSIYLSIYLYLCIYVSLFLFHVFFLLHVFFPSLQLVLIFVLLLFFSWGGGGRVMGFQCWDLRCRFLLLSLLFSVLWCFFLGGEGLRLGSWGTWVNMSCYIHDEVISNMLHLQRFICLFRVHGVGGDFLKGACKEVIFCGEHFVQKNAETSAKLVFFSLFLGSLLVVASGALIRGQNVNLRLSCWRVPRINSFAFDRSFSPMICIFDVDLELIRSSFIRGRKSTWS